MKKVSAIALFLLAVVLLTIPIVVVMNQKHQSNKSNAEGVANPLAGLNLKYSNNAAQYNTVANQWQTTRASDAALLRKVGEQQKAVWFAEDWNPATSIAASVDKILTQAASTGATPVFVVYSIPKRDCSGYSGGGSPSVAAYQNWIQQYANGLNHRRAIMILEPDALMMIDCLSAQEKTDRFAMLQFATTAFKNQGANVYIDGGNARWVPASTVAQRLTQAGIASADGFAVNVSNFYSTEETATYGNQVSSQAGGKHFVIDTSRNGLGPYIYPTTGQPQWCNPPGRALGLPATTETGNGNIDAFLWIKTPGQSDGQCTEFGQNDPSAGTFMPEYALGLAKRASWLQPQLSPTATPLPLTNTPTPTKTPTPTILPTATVKPTATPIPTNILLNSSFEQGMTPWELYVQSPAAGKVSTTTSTKADGKSSAKIVITKSSTQPAQVQFRQKNLSLVATKTYTLRFWAKASNNVSIQTIVQQMGNGTIHSTNNTALTTIWKQYTYTFQVPATSIDQLAFNVAKTQTTIWIDGVSLISN